MSVVMLKLAGPMQSWGADSRFTERTTRHEPTKSGVVGLLASALGRRRTDPIDDLAALNIGVRVDQPGHFERDFHTAHKRKWNAKTQSFSSDYSASMPLSHRYYLSDAVFVVAVQADELLSQELATALDHPIFPLYLGRRSCSPSCRVLLGVRDEGDVMQALTETSWQASDWYRRYWRYRHRRDDSVNLEVVSDEGISSSENLIREVVRDVPLSFSQEKRDYTWRETMRTRISIPLNIDCMQDEHDPWSALEGV